MLRHLIGFGAAMDRGLQISLTTVLKAKHGDVEHEAITITKGVIEIQFFMFHTLHEAKHGVAHVREGGIWAPGVLEEKLLPDHFPVWLQGI